MADPVHHRVKGLNLVSDIALGIMLATPPIVIAIIIFWSLNRYRTTRSKIDLTYSQIAVWSKKRAEYLRDHPIERATPDGKALFDHGRIGDWFKIYPNGVFAHWGTIQPPWEDRWRSFRRTDLVLVRRFMFVPMDRIEHIFPIGVGPWRAPTLDRKGFQIETKDYMVAVFYVPSGAGAILPMFIEAFGDYWDRLYRPNRILYGHLSAVMGNEGLDYHSFSGDIFKPLIVRKREDT